MAGGDETTLYAKRSEAGVRIASEGNPFAAPIRFAFHNHSVDYNADVWMSYGGGVLALATGVTWSDPIGHSNTPSVQDEYADVSIAGGPSSGCPGVRFLIHCRQATAGKVQCLSICAETPGAAIGPVPEP